MKLKATVVSLAFAAGILASIAVAKPPPGHGQGNGHGKGRSGGSVVSSTGSSTASSPEQAPSCRPNVSMILKGSFVGAGSDGKSFAMDVKQANRHGREFVGKQVSLMVDARTKFRRNGQAQLSDFVAGDRLNVQARACKPRAERRRGPRGSNDGAAAAPAQAPVLLAQRVVGHASSGSGGEGDDGGSTTSTGSTSTGSTSTGSTSTGSTSTATTESTPTETSGTTTTSP